MSAQERSQLAALLYAKSITGDTRQNNGINKGGAEQVF
jgi:hypothetical protein